MDGYFDVKKKKNQKEKFGVLIQTRFVTALFKKLQIISDNYKFNSVKSLLQ